MQVEDDKAALGGDGGEDCAAVGGPGHLAHHALQTVPGEEGVVNRGSNFSTNHMILKSLYFMLSL